jgi:putative PIN family toxin of toxin-antitoxin system
VRLVLDTNVVVSGLMRERGNPAAVVNAVLDDATIVLLWDERILDEYGDVLARPRLGIDPAKVRVLLDRARYAGERVAALRYEGAMTDEDDRAFVEVAITGRADILVTGNRKHFPADEALPSWLRIVSPRQLVVTLFVRSLLRAILPWT